MRAYVSTQSLHPQWTGYCSHTWKREWQSVREQHSARGGPVSQEWLASPFYRADPAFAGWGEEGVGAGATSLNKARTSETSSRSCRFLQRWRHGLSRLGFRFGESAMTTLARHWRSLFLYDRSARRASMSAEIELLHSTLPELSLAIEGSSRL